MFPNSEPLERKDTLLLKEACAGDSYQKTKFRSGNDTKGGDVRNTTCPWLF